MQLFITESPFVRDARYFYAPHSRRADLGPYPGGGKTQDSNLRTLEPPTLQATSALLCLLPTWLNDSVKTPENHWKRVVVRKWRVCCSQNRKIKYEKCTSCVGWFSGAKRRHAARATCFAACGPLQLRFVDLALRLVASRDAPEDAERVVDATRPKKVC